MTTAVVLSFPAMLLAGATVALLLRLPREELAGRGGFLLYLGLLCVPLAAVLWQRPGLPADAYAPRPASPLWAAAGAAVGVGLWGVQTITARRRPSRAVWAGPRRFAPLVPALAAAVVAEELVWRGHLPGAVGPTLAALAFGLHHWPFGRRHVVFAFGAGLAWGAMAACEGGLYAATASHLTHNALAWAWLRRGVSEGRSPPTRK